MKLRCRIREASHPRARRQAGRSCRVGLGVLVAIVCAGAAGTASGSGSPTLGGASIALNASPIFDQADCSPSGGSALSIRLATDRPVDSQSYLGTVTASGAVTATLGALSPAQFDPGADSQQDSIPTGFISSASATIDIESPNAVTQIVLSNPRGRGQCWTITDPLDVSSQFGPPNLDFTAVTGHIWSLSPVWDYEARIYPTSGTPVLERGQVVFGGGEKRFGGSVGQAASGGSLFFLPSSDQPLDSTPPTVTGLPDRPANANGWYSGNVTIDWQATDPAPSSGTPTDPPDTVASTEGANVAYTSASSCDPAGNCATGSLALSMDRTAPSVTCNAVSFLVNQPEANVSASVTDGLSGPATASVSAAVSTAGAGAFATSLTGTDNAGNTTTISCPYTVGYHFTGFQQPIDNEPTVNTANAGKTIPIKWRLTDYNGVGISDPASFVSVTSGSTTCSASDPTDAVETYSGNSGLQYLGSGNWQFNWATPKSYAGECRVMHLNLVDGGANRIASFKFK